MLAVRSAFARGGVEALHHDRQRVRKRRKLTAELEQKLIDTTLQTKPLGATHWSTRRLAKHLGVSHMTVQRAWQSRELQPHRVAHFKLSNDPHFEDKVRDVVGLYLNPAERALVLCVDEKARFKPWIALRPCCRCAQACPNDGPMTTSAMAPPPCSQPLIFSAAKSSVSVRLVIAARNL